MEDKEIICNLMKVISNRENKIMSLLKRMPIESLSIEDQERVIMDGIF